MLAQARQADIAMAPAADMFEMGVKVQVLKRGTLFAMRSAKLYELYRTHDGLDQIPDGERASLEKTIFRAPLEAIWDQTKAFFQERDPARIERSNDDPKQKMALVFRWYLGMSSYWATSGDPGRTVDYQIWCGPAMAAFNDWVRGSFLEAPENRRVAAVALNILYGAAVLTRARIASIQGVRLPAGVPRLIPLDTTEIENRLFLS
jgi:PfaD family protein